MPACRSQERDFNFDSLMDVVTNLTGGLILLVVLLVAITKPMADGVTTLPLADNKVGGEQPMDALLERIHAMRQQLEAADREVRGAESRIADLSSEIDALLRESSNAQ